MSFTRIDKFDNMDEAFKFWEFAKRRGAKTMAEMVEALEAYKRADLIVEEHKERLEAMIVEAAKRGEFRRPHESNDEHHCPDCGPRNG